MDLYPFEPGLVGINDLKAYLPVELVKSLQAMEELIRAGNEDFDEDDAKQAVANHINLNQGLYKEPERILRYYAHQGVFPQGTNPEEVGFSEDGSRTGSWDDEDDHVLMWVEVVNAIEDGTYKGVPPTLRDYHTTEAIMWLNKNVRQIHKFLKDLELKKKIKELEELKQEVKVLQEKVMEMDSTSKERSGGV